MKSLFLKTQILSGVELIKKQYGGELGKTPATVVEKQINKMTENKNLRKQIFKEILKEVKK